MYTDILANKILEVDTLLPNPNETVELVCYQALKKIRAILDDDRLDDPQCFDRIEEIVDALEEAGTNGGFRHDFG